MGASNFWGTDGQYKYLHRWVGVTSGKPQHCEQADETCKGRFEWANKSGMYLKEVGDWVRLCRSHHRRHDDATSTHAILRPKTHCKIGHEFTPDNTVITNTGRGRTAKRCLKCRRINDLAYYYRKKEKPCL